MDPVTALPRLLGLAWLLPLASFVLIVFLGPRMGRAGRLAGYVATGAILTSCVLSLVALLGVWLPNYGGAAPVDEAVVAEEHGGPSAASAEHGEEHADAGHAAAGHATGHGGHAAAGVKPITGDWYTLGQFGSLRITIGYYIDSLTVLMFCMVTLIATCIHVYSFGYMHDELHEVTDPKCTLPTATTCTAAAASTASSSTCRCSASACWAWSSPATWRWCSSSGSWWASAPTS